jgi:hypothetical protein
MPTDFPRDRRDFRNRVLLTLFLLATLIAALIAVGLVLVGVGRNLPQAPF